MSPDTSHLPILETERLRVVPLVAEDAQYIFPLMRDAEVMAFWDMPESDDPDLIAAIVEGQVEEMAQGRAAYWAMRSLPGEEFVGVCDLSEIDRRHKRAEVGFLLSREAWGQGFALEAMQVVIA